MNLLQQFFHLRFIYGKKISAKHNPRISRFRLWRIGDDL